MWAPREPVAPGIGRSSGSREPGDLAAADEVQDPWRWQQERIDVGEIGRLMVTGHVQHVVAKVANAVS
jgi:hypothetical protein